MFNAAIGLQLLGAFTGIFLISRIFWLVAWNWPSSVSKAVALNAFCFALVTPLDMLTWLSNHAEYEYRRVILFAASQLLVLIIDTFRMKEVSRDIRS